LGLPEVKEVVDGFFKAAIFAERLGKEEFVAALVGSVREGGAEIADGVVGPALA
jgi:hypothetical protein